MHQGNWKCSTCGGVITELPFEPRSESGLTCRTCYMKSKDSTTTDGAQAADMPAASEAPDIPEEAGLAGEAAPADDFGGTASAPSAPGASGERPTFTGDWKCADCGGGITSLPFEPRDTSGLKCMDCFKKSKA